MVSIRFHLDDVNHIDDDEKKRLRDAFAKAGEPAIIQETHAFVSSDLTHDNAFVQHINDDYITPSAAGIQTHARVSDHVSTTPLFGPQLHAIHRQLSLSLCAF